MPPKRTDALDSILRQHYEGRPTRIAALNQAVVDARVAGQIHDLRQKAGLTQRELAQVVGTQPSVICRLEDADYTGHSLSMLARIAGALGYDLIAVR